MSNKKAARRRGDNITYFVDGISGRLVDFRPKGPQEGQPKTIRYREWEKKYQDHTYLVVDEAWKKPPVLRPTKESLAKLKAGLQTKRAEGQGEPAKPSEEREAALRGVVRRVARWEGSQTLRDLSEAKVYAKFVAELWPNLHEQILEEFRRASKKEG